MLTKNVQFAKKPDKVMIRRIQNGYMCYVDLVENIREMKENEETNYIADVYSVQAGYTAGLKERVERDYEKWLMVAKDIPAPQPTVTDIVDAINALAELVIGGI